MPAHLRLVKPGESEKSAENEVRELADVNLFEDLAPEPILTVSRSTLSFVDLANKLDLAESEGSTAGHSNIVCTKTDLSYKEKAIQLFAYALSLRVIANMDCVLWEKSRFNEALAKALDSRHAVKKTEIPNHITLSPAIQLHLKQAGFGLQAREENQVLTDFQVREFYGEMLATRVAPARLRKVA